MDLFGRFLDRFLSSKDWILQFSPLTLEIFGFIWIYLDLLGWAVDRFLSSKDWILQFFPLTLKIFGFIWIYLDLFGFIWIYLDLFGRSSIDSSPQKIGYFGFPL